MSSAAPVGGPALAYRTRRDRAGAERDALARLSARLANLRLLAFALAGVALVAALWRPAAPLWALSLILFVLFGVLVARHRRVDRRRDRAARRYALNEEALARLERRWEALPLRDARPVDPQHPYARDLDVFGPASLFHLLQTASTPGGLDTLADWLGRPARPEVARARQVAVADLAPRLDWRQDLALQASLLGQPAPDVAPFLRWAEAPPWLTSGPAWLWAARIAPLLLLLAGAASAAGLVAFPLWLAPLTLNVLLHARLSGPALQTIDTPLAFEGAFRAYAGALGLVSGAPSEAPLLRQLRDRLAASGRPAAAQMTRLYRLTGLALPGTHLLYLPVQVLTLWNVHVLALFEGWQRSVRGAESGPRDWLTALGEAEALAALAGLAYDNPAWATPDFDAGAAALEATDLAHPLLPPAGRVPNGVRAGPPGTFLLVSGSNMAGKSTLLRAIGANVVLAGAGAPVCARELRLPAVRLWTAMRVEDSLRGGVSTFLAEARRMKALLDAAGAAGPRLLYLLDEPFRGTNARERRVAVRLVVAALVARGAIGAVATHDLDLADDPRLAPAADAVHFAETVVDGASGPGMTFDYRARPGLATTTNALRVLALVGLPEGLPEDLPEAAAGGLLSSSGPTGPEEGTSRRTPEPGR